MTTAAASETAADEARAGTPLHRDRMVLGWTAARGISSVGDQVWFVALTWSAAQLGSPALAGLVLACGSVPRALLILLGGALADRWDTRRVMIRSDLARIAVLGTGFAVFLFTGLTPGLLICVALVFGVVDALYDPASATLPRQLVAKSELGRLAGIRQLCDRFGLLGGAPLGGLVVAASGLGGAMVVDAVSFAVIAVVLLGIRPRRQLERSTGKSALGDVREGMRYLRDTPDVRGLIIALSGLNVFVVPVDTVGVVLRAHANGWGASGVGWLTGAVGGGAALGTVLALRWRPARQAFTGLTILFAQAAACVVVGFAPFAGALAAMAVIGVTAGLASPMLAGAFQATVGERYLGRCGSVQSMADAALVPLALAGFGAFAGVAGVAAACAVCGFGYMLLLAYAVSRPHVRRLRIDAVA